MALIVHYTDARGDHALVTIPDGEPRSRNLVLGEKTTREGAIRMAEQLPDVLRSRPRYVYDPTAVPEPVRTVSGHVRVTRSAYERERGGPSG